MAGALARAGPLPGRAAQGRGGEKAGSARKRPFWHPAARQACLPTMLLAGLAASRRRSWFHQPFLPLRPPSVPPHPAPAQPRPTPRPPRQMMALKRDNYRLRRELGALQAEMDALADLAALPEGGGPAGAEPGGAPGAAGAAAGATGGLRSPGRPCPQAAFPKARPATAGPGGRPRAPAAEGARAWPRPSSAASAARAAAGDTSAAAQQQPHAVGALAEPDASSSAAGCDQPAVLRLQRLLTSEQRQLRELRAAHVAECGRRAQLHGFLVDTLESLRGQQRAPLGLMPPQPPQQQQPPPPAPPPPHQQQQQRQQQQQQRLDQRDCRDQWAWPPHQVATPLTQVAATVWARPGTARCNGAGRSGGGASPHRPRTAAPCVGRRPAVDAAYAQGGAAGSEQRPTAEAALALEAQEQLLRLVLQHCFAAPDAGASWPDGAHGSSSPERAPAPQRSDDGADAIGTSDGGGGSPGQAAGDGPRQRGSPPRAEAGTATPPAAAAAEAAPRGVQQQVACAPSQAAPFASQAFPCRSPAAAMMRQPRHQRASSRWPGGTRPTSVPASLQPRHDGQQQQKSGHGPTTEPWWETAFARPSATAAAAIPAPTSVPTPAPTCGGAGRGSAPRDRARSPQPQGGAVVAGAQCLRRPSIVDVNAVMAACLGGGN
jgi:hypothetical protein